MLTMPDPQLPSGDEYNIAALLSAETVRKVMLIQEKLQQVLGDTIWLTPPAALHITLMEIICNTEYAAMSRKQHFDVWHKRYDKPVQAAIASFTPVDVIFTDLIVSPAAIIIKAADPAPFNKIRSKLLEVSVLPTATKQPPDITHCSIARYNRAIDLDEAQNSAHSIRVDLIEHITGFQLVRDLGPPEFDPVIMSTYTLGG